MWRHRRRGRTARPPQRSGAVARRPAPVGVVRPLSGPSQTVLSLCRVQGVCEAHTKSARGTGLHGPTKIWPGGRGTQAAACGATAVEVEQRRRPPIPGEQHRPRRAGDPPHARCVQPLSSEGTNHERRRGLTSLLTGHTALVTGASSGIGAAVARTLGRHGALVAVNYRSNADAAAAVVGDIERAGSRAIAVDADVTDADAVDAMVAGSPKSWATSTDVHSRRVSGDGPCPRGRPIATPPYKRLRRKHGRPERDLPARRPQAASRRQTE